MNLLLLIVCLTLSLNTLAEDYATGGGYDPKSNQMPEKADYMGHDEDYWIKKQQEIDAKKKKRISKQIEKEKQSFLPENMANMKDHEVCVKAGKYSKNNKSEPWLLELNRRGAKYDPWSIKNSSIKINGFECDIFAAYGLPLKYNRHVTARGTRVQFVYENQYIYTDNGIITSWQD